MTNEDFKDLPGTTASAKILRDKTFNIAKPPKYDGCPGGLASMVYKFFDKRTSGSGVKSKIMSNQELPEELQKPIIRKLEKLKVYSSFIDNI